MSAPKEWWSEEGSTKPGPSRIRITVNREFTPAEAEALKTRATLLSVFLGDKMRVVNNRIWFESSDAASRVIFRDLAEMLANSFVNVYPVAVRTFRELSPDADLSFANALADEVRA